MVRVKTSVITGLRTTAYCDKLENCIGLMANNPTYPSPSPALPTIQSGIDALRLLEMQSLNGDRTVIANKRTARYSLNLLFLQLCIYINSRVFDIPNAEELINGIGLEATKSGSQPVATLPTPENVTSVVSTQPGCVDLSWECPTHRGVHSFIIEMAEGSDAATEAFRQVATSTTQKFSVSGLQRGEFYTFRIRCVGSKSRYSNASETTVCMAG